MLGFPPIDVGKLKRELRVREQAMEEARDGLPHHTDTELDAAQHGIVHVVGQMLEDARTQTFEVLQQQQRARDEIELEMDVLRCEAVPDEARQRIGRARSDSRDDLVGLRARERSMLRERNFFIELNKLNREPDYPQSHTFHWALVVVAVVAESLANSYFFAKGSDFGLLGGTFQAMLISVANIGTALMIGVYVVPQFNHVRPGHRYAAAGGASVYTVVIGAFNLATAHYRAQLELDPFNALVNTIPRLLAEPFGVDNYDAWVLFIIGLGFATFASIKGYTSDDPYPRYGRVDRNYQAAREAYDAAKQALMDNVNAVIDQKGSQLDRQVQALRRNAQRYGGLITESETYLQEFAHYAEAVDEATNTLLREYRDGNIKVRAGEPPAYFGDAYSFDDTKALPPLDLSDERKTSEKFEKIIVKLDEVAGLLHNELRQINQETLENIKNFFAEIEEEAERRLVEDKPAGQG